MFPALPARQKKPTQVYVLKVTRFSGEMKVPLLSLPTQQVPKCSESRFYWQLRQWVFLVSQTTQAEHKKELFFNKARDCFSRLSSVLGPRCQRPILITSCPKAVQYQGGLWQATPSCNDMLAARHVALRTHQQRLFDDNQTVWNQQLHGLMGYTSQPCAHCRKLGDGFHRTHGSSTSIEMITKVSPEATLANSQLAHTKNEETLWQEHPMSCSLVTCWPVRGCFLRKKKKKRIILRHTWFWVKVDEFVMVTNTFSSKCSSCDDNAAVKISASVLVRRWGATLNSCFVSSTLSVAADWPSPSPSSALSESWSAISAKARKK